MQEFGAGFGSIYYTPGESNTGIPNFSENSMYSLPVSYGADGYNRVSWVDWSTNGKDGFTHMIPEIQTYSAMAYGEYTLSGEANLTPYFEVMYSQRDSFHNSGAYQLFPYVPANNPFSPCNPAAVGGVDCGDAWDAVLRSPEYAARFSDAYGATPQEYYDNGWGNFFNNPEGDAPLGALLMRPIVHVMGDRTLSDVTANQQRIVLGLRGDMPCADNFDQGLSADVTSGCVPVNMWVSSLYDPVIDGDFGSAAERNYLFDTRDFRTEYRQTIFSGYANGEVFDLPGGEALFGIGIEYREDEINSIPDDVARDGLFFGFFSDGGAAVSNMRRQANDFLNRDDGIGEIWREVYLYGAVQPTEEVPKVNVPVLLIHGSVDHRVLLRQAKMYLKELEKYNKPHKYLELEGAEHFSNTLFYHHQLELYTTITEFLANDCGPNGISRDLSAAN